MKTITEKQCCRCKKVLPIYQFWRRTDKRYVPYCKNCSRLILRDNRARNEDTFKSKDKRYYDKHKQEISDKRKKDYKENYHKSVARQTVRSAIKKGTLVRRTCEKCPSLDSEAHHPDYTKPLEVVWLCGVCHHRLHWGK